MARQEGLEPPTFWFVAKHSIRLSYWRIIYLCQSMISQLVTKCKPFFEFLSKNLPDSPDQTARAG